MFTLGLALGGFASEYLNPSGAILLDSMTFQPRPTRAEVSDVSTAIRHGVFSPGCTCLWLGLYAMDQQSEGVRKSFLEQVERTFRDGF